MRIGVPGEFHEDRWPRTAEDSERHVLPRTREAGGDVQTLWSEVMSECAPAHTGSGRSPSDTSYRVAKGRKSVPLQGLRSGSRPGLARHTRLQVVLRQGRVMKGTSIGTSVRGPSTEALLGQRRVPKGRESVSLTGLWSSLRPGSTRHPVHRRLSAIPAWRRGHLSALRHGHPAYRCPSGILAWRRGFCKGEGGGIGQY